MNPIKISQGENSEDSVDMETVDNSGVTHGEIPGACSDTQPSFDDIGKHFGPSSRFSREGLEFVLSLFRKYSTDAAGRGEKLDSLKAEGVVSSLLDMRNRLSTGPENYRKVLLDFLNGMWQSFSNLLYCPSHSNFLLCCNLWDANVPPPPSL